MQKRILIAFLLSFVVLSVWSAIFPPPKRVITESTQVIDNKELKSEIDQSVDTIDVSPALSTVVEEETQILENNKIAAEFSNVGGSLKSVTIKEYNTSLPITKIFTVEKFDNVKFTLKNISKSEIVYVYQNDGKTITKKYELSDNDYLITVNVQTEKMSILNIDAYTIDSQYLDKGIFQSPEKALHEYSIGLINKIIRHGNAIEFSVKDNKSEAGEISWIGYRDRYFCLVIKPKFKASEFSANFKDKNQLLLKFTPSDKSLNNYSATIYAGPQKLSLLSSYKEGFENIMVFSAWSFLDICAKVIYGFVHILHGVVKNWGLAIILLGISIFGLTYPLTAKTMTSMRKMQALQPKMKSLQEKYKKDPQRLNKEMMELYKENKVNPFGGCFPMLLQMPIFLGLYQVLWRSVDFKGAQFLWIKDLSMPDRLATMPFSLPFLGNEFNILPLLMAVTMFFQQKFSSKNMVIADENQLMQQKMMLILMPVMMGFIFYHFASGLSLYFTVFYLLSTLMQWKMSKVSPIAK
ncbi:MAG: YidC/Oxa1 family insertase periplasmic-domain containing protein [Candidatus Omnitrophica bacterium]|nr:YidC/Oxa1 family insertase periplasmic-domain containing protein [Candidatus Omnitrophota bacterium]